MLGAARRAARCLATSVTSKESTGLVGMPVNKHARKDLIALYNKTLEQLNEKIPAEAEYRKVTEKLTKERLEVVLAEKNQDTIERKINGGQIEELVLQAERELELVVKMAEWKPWEPLAHPAPAGQW